MGINSVRHYEVVAIVHPEYSDQAEDMLVGYRQMIEDAGGKITRTENWGRRNLAYQIDKIVKGHYILINFSCEDSMIVENLQDNLDNDDPVIRILITRTETEVSGPSPVMVALEKTQEEKEKEEA